MADPYQIVLLNPEDLEDSARDPKLTALRASGFRVVGTLPVETRGQPRLALILEPPIPTEAAQVIREVREPASWRVAISVLAILFAVAAMLVAVLT